MRDYLISMIKASKRSQGVSYAIRDIVLPAKKLEKKGISVLHLNIGDPNKYDFDTPHHMKDALFEASNERHNGYSPSEGYLELRTGIVEREQKRNNVTYTPDDLCITTGVTESLQILLNASLDPGDELLIPGPTYPQYALITRFNNAEPVAYCCIEEYGWQPDVEDIRKKISKRTKGIVLINPNNPTGALYSKNVIKNIIDLAGEYKLPVISDEISETDVRRSIQKLLEEIIDSLGEELGQKFINEFKNSLEKNCLLRIEEIGVNLHMIQLRHELLGKT